MNPKEKTYRAQAKTVIDRVLEHRNDAFKAKVLKMTLKNHWDVDDPAFLILLSTGEMRVLMEQHPAQFEALMNRVFKRAESQFISMHAQLMVALTTGEMAAQALAQRVDEVEALLGQEHIRLVTAQQRLATRLETATAHQIERLEMKAVALTAEGFAVSRTQAKEQVAVMAKQLRQMHYWEALAWACLAAVMLSSHLPWVAGWHAASMTRTLPGAIFSAGTKWS